MFAIFLHIICRRIKCIMKKLECQIKKYYTVKEAAIYLAVCEKSVRRLIGRGLLKPSRALRKLLIPLSELEDFFDRTA